MKLNINAKTLQEAIKKANTAIGATNVIPILANVWLKFKDGNLQVTGSDTETTLSVTIPAEGEGEFLIPASKVGELLKELGDQEVEITLETPTSKIKSTQGTYKFSAATAEDYPKPIINDMAKRFQLTKDQFTDIIKTVSFAVKADEINPVMGGVCFDLKENETIFVATDGMKLGLQSLEKSNKEVVKVIVPIKPLKALESVAGDFVNVSFDETNIKFETEGAVVIGRLISGNYPPYERILPESASKIAKFDKGFKESLNRVALFSNERSQQIKMTFNKNNLLLSAIDLDYGNAAKEDVVVKSNIAEEFEIGVNARALKALMSTTDSEEYVFEMTEPTRPIIIKTGQKSLKQMIAPISLS